MPIHNSAKKQAKRAPHRTHWSYGVIVVVFALVGLVLSQPVVPLRLAAQRGVLAYATDVTSGGLLVATNQERAANGVAALAVNSKLTQAAQAKANDMAARDYWSHDTPEGNPPWVFIDAAGYSYTAAGENLAYGFATSSNVVTGWMNSPGHKANLLNTLYQEVGFGYANAASYQGNGQQTVVVAMYGKPSVPIAPPPPPPAPAPAPVPTPPPAAPTAPTPPPSAPPPVTPPPAPMLQPKPIPPAPAPAVAPVRSIPAAESRPVSLAEQLTGGRAPWIAFAVGVVGGLAAMTLVFKHAKQLHRLIRDGERFILHHPLLDAVLVPLVILSIYLSQTTGFVR